MEKVEIKEDGSIEQVECTSMGFNDGPLIPKGEFPAPISCVLTNGRMPHCTNTTADADIPYIIHGNNERFITNIKTGTKIGYKYFEFKGKTKISVKTRGVGNGKFDIRTDEGKVGEITISPSKDWEESSVEVNINSTQALYFIYHGSEFVEFLSFNLLSK